MSISTGVLDNFNRTDGGLGSNWATIAPTAGVQALSIDSNQAAASSGGVHAMYWSASSFVADCEVYVTLATPPGNSGTVLLAARLLAPGTLATYNGYDLGYSNLATDVLVVRRVTSGVPTTLLTIEQTLGAGDRFGMSLVGDTITVYVDTGSGWTALDSVQDSTYEDQAGYIGLGTQAASVARMDDFGGGNYTPPGVVVEAAAGALTLTGQLATVDVQLPAVVVAAAAGVVAMTGHQATIDVQLPAVVVEAAAGVVAVVGKQAMVVAPTTVAAAVGVVTVAGKQATIDVEPLPGVTVAAAAGVVAVVGKQALVVAPTTVAAAVGVVTVAGKQAVVDVELPAVVVQAAAGVVAVVGKQAVVDGGRFVVDLVVGDELLYALTGGDELLYSVVVGDGL